MVDALRRRMIPGFGDARLHVIRGGLDYVRELRRNGVRTLRQGLAMLREQAARTPEGQWVRVVGGWSAEQSAERRLPTVAELNAAAPDTPVFVLHPYRSAILNRAALRAVGCDRPPAGRSCGTGRRTHGHAPGRPERPDPVLGPGQGAGAGQVVRPKDGDEWLRPDGAGESLTWAAADFENFAQPRPEHAPDYEVEFERAVRLLMENGWGFRLHATVSSSVAGADQDSGVPRFESTARVGTVRTPTTCLVPSSRGNAPRDIPDHFIFTLISWVVTHHRKGNYLTSGHAHRGGILLKARVRGAVRHSALAASLSTTAVVIAPVRPARLGCDPVIPYARATAIAGIAIPLPPVLNKNDSGRSI
ncbi:amidohydrolase family protein [Streptomyces sp. ISL-12]|uniref:amidohydrolase family protein n=1 Tax=Streptomyces sp. ISL-12 TaxID=2819177 RepID=UPI0035AB6F4D